MKSIKDQVLEMVKSAKDIYSLAFKSSQKYVLWMDKKQQNNRNELDALQKDYKD